MTDIEYRCECGWVTWVLPVDRADNTYEFPNIICGNCKKQMIPYYDGEKLEE